MLCMGIFCGKLVWAERFWSAFAELNGTIIGKCMEVKGGGACLECLR